MSNPWLKKNPFMSMWLSNANRVVHTARGRSAAQAKKQTGQLAAAATYNAASAIMDMWIGTAMAAKPAKTRRKR